jgi:hypothetical protein
MASRRNFERQNKVQEIINVAVEKSRRPGDGAFASPSSSTGGTATVSPAIDGSYTYPDEDGNTIRPFMLDQDRMDDPTARLA